MPLEATMICIDNSEWMRNGDFVPTRLQSQKDAVHIVCNAKLRSHPENTFGVLTMGGKRTSVLMNLTSDVGRVISAIHNIPYEGECDLLNAVQVAQLALKHRQNKQQAQRIIVFVGSPQKADKDELVKLGKRLKKNNIALDVVNFGETEDNRDKLEAVVAAVVNDDNSHIISVPAGPQIVLSDVLRQSPIISAAASGASGAPAEAAGGGFDFDVDPTMDPELAMALKMSYEEEKARQEAQKKTQEPKDSSASSAAPTSTPASTPTPTPTTASTPTTPAPAPAPAPAPSTSADVDMYEDDEIAQAIALSMKTKAEDENKTKTQPATPSTPAPTPAVQTSAPQVSSTHDVAMADLDDEDEELKLAMQLSLQASKEPAPSTPSASTTQAKPAGATDLTQQALDPAFLESLLTNLPGVDVNDPSIQNTLASLKGGEKKDEKKEDKK